MVEGVVVFGGLLGRRKLLYKPISLYQESMGGAYTLTLSTILETRLLQLGYSFRLVVCFESGFSSRRLLVDDITIRVAEDLRTCCNEE